jgi:RecB family exonuclease
LRVGDSETIYFHGRADRLDRTGRGLWVRDYKRRDSDGLKLKPGQPPPPKSWPLIIYTLAAAAHFGLPADSSFEILDSAGGAGLRPGLSSDHTAMSLTSGAGDEENIPRLLAETWAAIKAGVFRPEGENNCAYCLFGRLCPRLDGEAGPEEPA